MPTRDRAAAAIFQRSFMTFLGDRGRGTVGGACPFAQCPCDEQRSRRLETRPERTTGFGGVVFPPFPAAGAAPSLYSCAMVSIAAAVRPHRWALAFAWQRVAL